MGDKILVTGITGKVGYQVAKQLYLSGAKIKGAVRIPQKAKVTLGEEFKDVEFVRFGFSLQATYDEALKDVNKIFIVRPLEDAGTQTFITHFLDYAKGKGIEHIVFLSIMGAEKNFMLPHGKIEKHIMNLGIPYTILRSSLFMQNFNTIHMLDIKEKNDILVPAGKAKVSFIDVRDIGEAAATVLLEDIHLNCAYTLTGGKAISFSEAADIFSSVLGRTIKYSNPSPIRFRQVMLDRELGADFANAMSGIYIASRLGSASKVTPELENILERKPRAFEDYINEYIEEWA